MPTARAPAMTLPMTMKRWKLTIEYDGAPFCGWQRQKTDPSIQQAIEEAIEKFCQQEIRIYAAGRTDAGVHARGQVAHFDLDYGDRPLRGFDLAKAINAHLRPKSVSIIHAEEVSQDFHARFSAQKRTYLYRLLTRSAPPILETKKIWHVRKKFDVDAMRDAATVLLGTHDFSTFRDQECQAKSPIKTLDRFDIETLDYDGFGNIEYRIHVESLSFLHHQVRNMVGALSLVGEGKWTKQDLKDALEAKDRAAGGPTIPSDGLYLMKIDYPEK